MHRADLFRSDEADLERTEGADDRVSALFELLRRPEWYADALCAEYPTSLFFPEKGQATAPAKALCRRCTVRAECAEAGAYEPVGIWGGLTAQARKKALHRDAESVVAAGVEPPFSNPLSHSGGPFPPA